MEREAKPPFDPVAFLAKVGNGKTISIYQRDQDIFAQGDVADTIFYIQEGRIKLTVQSEQGKERWSGSWSPVSFSAKAA